jgi:hypothetical protein
MLILRAPVASSQPNLALNNQTASATNQTVTFPVSVNNAPHAVDAMGFDLTFASEVLRFDGFTNGALVQNWDFFHVSAPAAGQIRVAGFTVTDMIAAGTSGDLVHLHFTVLAESTATLSVVAPVDDVATWTRGTGQLEFAVNGAPQVNAGPDQTITLPNSAMLAGTVSDEGLPTPPAAVTVTWSQVSGPGTVTFSNANAVDTTATFSAPGAYVLRLTANDGALSASDDVSFTVTPDTQRPVANAGPDQDLILAPSQTTVTVALNGSASSAPDGGAIREFRWTGSPEPDDVERPMVTLGLGTHHFALTVVDNEGSSSAEDVVQIRVFTVGMFTPQRGNTVAGNAVTLAAGQTDIQSILFQGRPVGTNELTDIGTAARHPSSCRGIRPDLAMETSNSRPL